MTQPNEGPSGALTGVAAAIPSVFLFVGCAFFGAAAAAQGGASGLWMTLREGAPWTFGILLVVAIAWLAITGLLFAAGRGVPVPAAFTIGVAGLPILVGVAGTVAGTETMLAALHYADAASRATMAARAISQSTISGMLGGHLSSALFAAVAWGYAIAAFAQRAPQRSVVGGAIGAVASVPLLGLALWGVLEQGFGAMTLALAGFGAALAAGIAGAAAGADEPKGRSGPLAAAATVAGALSVAAAALAARGVAFIQVFAAVASADPVARGEMMGMAASEMMGLVWAARLALPVGLLATAAVGGWAFTRRKPSAPQLIAGAVAVFVALFVIGSDGLVNAWSASQAEGLQRGETWREIEGVEPVAFEADWDPTEVRAIVTPTALLHADGTSIGPLEAGTLGGFFGNLPDETFEEPEPLQAEPRVGLVIDERVSAEQLRLVMHAAGNAGVRAISFVGAGRGGIPSEHQDAVGAAMPLVGLVLPQGSSLRVLIGAALPPSFASDDPDLFHVALDGETVPTTVEVRPGSEASESQRTLDDYAYQSPGERALWVTLEGGTAAQLVEALNVVAMNGFTPVLTQEVPLPPPTTEDVESQGTLSREAIQSVVRRHTNEVRFCYERALQQNPNLAGRVMVHFVISPTGTVQSAVARENTVGDPQVGTCVAQAVQRWTFPAPEGGLVAVNYPFVFSAR